MTDTVLDLLTWALLGLLYLFFARVLWTVWTQVRAPHTTAAGIAATHDSSTRNTGDHARNARNISTDPTVDLADLTAAAQQVTPDYEYSENPTARSSRNSRNSRDSRSAHGTASLLRTAAHEITFLAPRSHKGQRIALEADTVLTIGRADTCTLPFPDDTYISGLHAQIRVHEGQPVIEDLGSTNGTFHNGNRLHGLALLHPGDRVQIGQTILEAR